MNIYSIYKATNKINGKVYIGFDSNWPQRMWEHKSPSNFNKKYKFYNALRKYGLDGFEWNVIYQSLDREHCLHTMEPFFIKEYNRKEKTGETYICPTTGRKRTNRQKIGIQFVQSIESDVFEQMIELEDKIIQLAKNALIDGVEESANNLIFDLTTDIPDSVEPENSVKK